MTGDAAMVEIFTEIIRQALPCVVGALLIAGAAGLAIAWCLQ
jgi:hypothetical protein